MRSKLLQGSVNPGVPFSDDGVRSGARGGAAGDGHLPMQVDMYS
jgi:hypothetical protein